MDTLPATINGFFCRDTKDVELAQQIIDPATTRAQYTRVDPKRSQFASGSVVAATEQVPPELLGVNRPEPNAERGALVNVLV